MAIRNTDTLITKDLTNNCAVISKKIAELVPDSRNANKGSPRGNQMIEDSLRQYGAGRSILLDKHGRIIAGNKTAEKNGRIAYGTELSPAYCDVIVTRWENATGKKAVLSA